MSVGLGGASFTVMAKVDQFSAGMKRAKDDATRTTQQIAAGLSTMSDRVESPLANVATKVDRVTKSIKGINNQLGTGKSTHFALGLMAVGNAVDDLQYGFRSIVNNIPQMVYMFSGSGGLAGGAAIAAVAVNQLSQHWEEMVNYFKASWLNVAFKDLEKLRIGAEKAADAFGKLMDVPTEAGAREISKIKEAVTELQAGGAKGLLKGIGEAVTNEPGMRAEETEGEKKMRAATLNIQKVAEAGGDHALAERMQKDIHNMNLKLSEANAETAKHLMGQAMQPDEEGAGARDRLRMLVNKYAGSFSADFVKALQRTVPIMVKGELDLEHVKAERARSAGVAGQLLYGPLGTQMMLGGGAAGPATAAALAAITAKGARRFGGVRPEMIEGMAKAGLTEEQARGVVGKMNPEATFKRGKELSQKLGVPLGGLGQVDGRVLMQAMRDLFAEAMKGAADKPGGLLGKIGGAMKAAGAEGEPKAVEAEMKAQLRDRVKNLMLERGITEAQAKRVILQDQAARAFGGSVPAQFMSQLTFAKGLPNQGNDVARRSLDELIAIRKALAAPMRLGRQMPIEPFGIAR